MIIPIFVDKQTRNPIVYNSSPSITLNDPNDDADNTYLIEDIDVQPVWDMSAEPNPDRDGTHTGQSRRIQTLITIRGWVKAPSHGALYDKVHALNRAFDPVLTYLNDSSTFDRGAMALDFNYPTADTANYPDGHIPLRYYGVSLRVPVPLTTKFDGLAARFVIQLRASDPRAYLQDISEVQRTGSGTVTVTNSLATYSSWPIIEIEFGASLPSTTMTIARQSHSATISILHTNIIAGDYLIIDSQARTATYLNGTDAMGLLSSSTRFFSINPASSHTVTFTNFPSNAICRVIWRRAYV